MRRNPTKYVSLYVVLVLSAVSFAYAQEEKPTPDSEKVIELRSLFFTEKEIEKIKQALAAYAGRDVGSSKPTDFDEEEWFDQVGELKEVRSQDRYFTYPQFFLESLVFRTDVDWTIWLNGQRITPESANGSADIKVTAIDKNQVSLQWRPGDFEKVRKTWEKSSNASASVDEAAGFVFFTLKPNQTFSSYVMKVLEGKVIPVTVDNQAIEKDFEEKVIIPEKISGAVQDLFSEKPVEETKSKDPASEDNVIPDSAQNPSELIGTYETEDQKKNDSSPTTNP